MYPLECHKTIIFSPLLFIIFVIDLSNLFQFSKSSLFANDLKLFILISSIHDCNKLQYDLNSCAYGVQTTVYT